MRLPAANVLEGSAPALTSLRRATRSSLTCTVARSESANRKAVPVRAPVRVLRGFAPRAAKTLRASDAECSTGATRSGPAPAGLIGAAGAPSPAGVVGRAVTTTGTVAVSVRPVGSVTVSVAVRVPGEE